MKALIGFIYYNFLMYFLNKPISFITNFFSIIKKKLNLIGKNFKIRYYNYFVWKNFDDFEKYNTQKYINRFIDILNTTPSNTISDQIDSFFENFFMELINSNISQKTILSTIFSFFNNIYFKIGIQKVYNNLSDFHFENYKNMSLGNQFMYNIYRKHGKFFDICKGGTCHNWTIFFKHLFEYLETLGINISSYIFLNKLSSNHSGVIVNFDNTIDYMVDTYSYNLKFGGKLVQSIENLSYNYNKKKQVQPNDTNVFPNDFNYHRKGEIQRYFNGEINHENLYFFDNIDSFLLRKNAINEHFGDIFINLNFNIADLSIIKKSFGINVKIYNNGILLWDTFFYGFGNCNKITACIQNIDDFNLTDFLISNISYKINVNYKAYYQKAFESDLKILRSCFNCFIGKVDFTALRSILSDETIVYNLYNN